MPTTAQGLYDAVAGTSKASREDTQARFGNYEPAAAASRPRRS
jgi:hypothetical protein